jgi:FixJ family two-component response regulator
MRTNQPLVIVVDDDDSVRSSLKRLLHSAGYEVRTFVDAQQVMAHGRPHEACCLILDVQIPGVSGLEFQRQLATRSIRIATIFLTGHGDIPTSVTAMKAGAVDFLSKPFDPAELLAAVGRAIEIDERALQENEHLRELRERSRTLTARETEVFEHVVVGLLNKQIAFELGITEKTVKIHRARVMEKMYAESLAELVRSAEILEHARREDEAHFGALEKSAGEIHARH